jgi:hypothetical protein
VKTFHLALALFLAHSAAMGQTVSSSVQGAVSDSTGAAVAGAQCVLTNQATGQATVSSTLADGAFIFASVAPGVYNLTIESPGFKKLALERVVVTSSETRTLGKLILQIGDVVESVSVQAESAALQLATAERAGLVSGAQLSEIAIKGRDLFGFLSTLPGVVNTTGNGGGADSASIGAIGGISINGNRNGSTNVAVDGVTNLNTGNNTNMMYEPNLDSVGEVKVLTSNFSAEYGRMGGGQVLIVTKSGSRDFHGTAYNYYRHESLNANGFFENRSATQKQPYRYRVTGYSIGGPLTIPGLLNRNRDKLFFFFSQDYSRTKVNPGTRFTLMPTALEREGNFSQTFDVNGALIRVNDPLNNKAQFPGNIIPASRINAQGQAVLKAYPLPNFTDPDPRNAYRWNYRTAFSSPYPKRQEVVKIDYNWTSTMRMSWRLVNSQDTQEAYYGLSQGKSGNVNYDLANVRYNVPGKGQVVNLTKTFSPTLIMETVFGFNQTRSQTDVVEEDFPLVSRERWGNLPRLNNNLEPGENLVLGLKPNFNWGNVSNPPNASMVAMPWYNVNVNYDLTHTFTKIFSKHQLKVGVFVTRVSKSDPAGGNYIGTYDFGRNINSSVDSNYGYSNAVLGNFNSYTEDNTRPTNFTRMWNLEPFIQDNWRVTSRLTLDYGVRFYHWTNAKDRQPSRQSSFFPHLYDPAQAVVLYRPAIVNGVRVGVDPRTGVTTLAANIGGIIPNSGNILNGIGIGGTTPGIERGVESFKNPLVLGPRFGFAYDVFGNGHTAVRGGFGMYFDRQTTGNALSIGGNAPARLTYSTIQSNIAQLAQATPILGSLAASGIGGPADLPAIMNFSFGVQQRVKDIVVDASYVGGLSRHLYQSRDYNAIPLYAQLNPANFDPTANNAPLPNSLLVPYPGFGNLNLNRPQATSNYNSLQLSANRRFSGGLQFGVSYTFSKALGMTTLTPNGYSLADPQFLDRNWGYGPLAFDRSHNLVFNYIYNTPRFAAKWGVKPAGWVLDDWQVSGITLFISGSPFTPGFSLVDNQNITGSALGARVVVTGDPSIPKSEKTFDRSFNTSVFARPAQRTFGNAGIGILRGPGINNWNLAIAKRFPIKSESRFFQFRAELFNAFNHTQFSNQNATARFNAQGQQIDATFGQYTAAREPRVMQLSLRLTF